MLLRRSTRNKPAAAAAAVTAAPPASLDDDKVVKPAPVSRRRNAAKSTISAASSPAASAQLVESITMVKKQPSKTIFDSEAESDSDSAVAPSLNNNTAPHLAQPDDETEDDDRDEPPEQVSTVRTAADSARYESFLPVRPKKRAKTSLPATLPNDVLERAALAASAKPALNLAPSAPSASHQVFSEDSDSDSCAPPIQVAVLGSQPPPRSPSAAVQFAASAFAHVRRVPLAKLQSSKLRDQPSVRFTR